MNQQQLKQQLIAWRHYLHAHPESAFEEQNTSRFIAEKLEAMGIEVHRDIGKTGVVGRLKCGDGKGVIAIRVIEKNGAPVSGVIVKPEDDIMLLSTGGKVVRTRAGEVPERGRNTVGNILIRMPDDTLAAVRRVDRTGEEDESEIEHLNVEVDPDDAGDLPDTDDLDDIDDDEVDEGDDAEEAENSEEVIPPKDPKQN